MTANIDFRLVEDDVGCGDLDDNESCEETVWGVKPSSITTFSTGISGLLGVVFMPICGAITDYTPNRRKWGMISAFVIIVINAIQIFVGKDTWEMLVVAAMVRRSHLTKTYPTRFQCVNHSSFIFQ